ncbi:MAG: hypothetical protein A2Z91_07580 [Deltaproteobacteria bacterium GWA2_38_16]|nr:MAG: hypothetical protein A2Z91_07580 [Deltaproteobacteria bacterium GWA2_38_16]HBQ20487.1 hypothetical protein [Deltaproteobacteria bacterium]
MSLCFCFSSLSWAQKNPLWQIQKELQVGGSDIPVVPLKAQKALCELSEKTGVYKILFNTLGGNECKIKIPLQPVIPSKARDLSHSALLAFRIRGEKDVQNFNVGLEANGHIEYVGPILEYLPFSVISSWTQTGIPIREFEAKGASVSQAQFLVFDFNEPAEGVLEVKDVVSVPRKSHSEHWDPVVILLSQYDLKRVKDIKTISMGHYGQEFGWKVGQLYHHSPEKSFSSGKIDMGMLKSIPPTIVDGYAKIADFNNGLENQVGGFFNEFQKAPSKSFVTLNPTIFRGSVGRSLEIIYEKESQGFCGAWVHFFDFKKPPKERIYLDATKLQYLSFWVRGKEGKEDVSIQLADASWEKTEDSVYYGKISDYLKGGITTEWQRVLIPLKQEFYKNLHFKKLAGLTFNFREKSKGTLYVDDVAFLTSRDSSPWVSDPSAQNDRGEPEKVSKKLYKAMWLWHTVRQLKNPKAQDEFFKFCTQNGVNLIFFQLQYELQKKTDGTYGCILKYEPELRKFIARASSYQIEVQALDGFSRFALKPWHEKVYAQIRSIIEYNKRVSSSERFTGIHHDNEPYLIPSYWGVIREGVMKQYLELCEKSQALVQNSGLSNFVFGVDIPFWYEEANFDFEVPVEITWRGVRKPASFHIIDIVDNVGIMDYRTKAYGADGTIVHGRNEIYYANSAGKKVLVGIETYPLPHEIFAIFRSNQPVQLANLSQKIQLDPRQLFMFFDQYQELGIAYMRRFREDLKDTPESISKEIFKLKIQDKEVILKSEIAVDVPSSKLSFSGMNKDYFLSIYEDTQNYFMHEPSFFGMAIHYYETYRQLMEGPSS